MCQIIGFSPIKASAFGPDEETLDPIPPVSIATFIIIHKETFLFGKKDKLASTTT